MGDAVSGNASIAFNAVGTFASTFPEAGSHRATGPRPPCRSGGMTHDAAIELLSGLFKLALLLCAPLLAVILVVGLVVSILQVVTQVQDPSVAFVPKLVLFVGALILLGPWMLARLTAYATPLLARL